MLDPSDPDCGSARSSVSLAWSQERAQRPWLWGVSGEQLQAAVADRVRQLQRLRRQTIKQRIDRNPPESSQEMTEPLRVILCATDPLDFWASFWAAMQVPSVLFLANPAWQHREWQQVMALAQPHGILGRSIVAPRPEEHLPETINPTVLQEWLPKALSTGSPNGGRDPQGRHNQAAGLWPDRSQQGQLQQEQAQTDRAWSDRSQPDQSQPNQLQQAQAQTDRSQPNRSQPDRSQPDQSQPSRSQPSRSPLQAGWILISTGGSSGQLRFVIHTLETLGAAVDGLRRSSLIPAPGHIHSFCTLPFHHVSGLMQGLRSWGTGGQLVTLPFKTLETALLQTPNQLAAYPLNQLPFCLSLVPTQLQRLLAAPAAPAWLAQFALIFLGGAPPWPTLLDRGRALGLPLAPTYGMTETAAMVTVLAPKDFLQGRSGAGPALPHVSLTVAPGAGQGPNSEPIGPLHIQTPALGLGDYSLQVSSSRADLPADLPATPQGLAQQLGYPPETGPPVTARDGTSTRDEANKEGIPTLHIWERDRFCPDDWGRVGTHGSLELLGRESSKIITGGENVFPAEVEAAIWASGVVTDVVVLGQPDSVWGERVVAVYVPQKGGLKSSDKDRPHSQFHSQFHSRSQTESKPDSPSQETDSVTEIEPTTIETHLRRWVRQHLAAYKCPKQWIQRDRLPRNAQGKLDRSQLQNWIRSS
ncbi:MAG: AMP-binding protein [Prochlorothrix sp.]|nr:AMP-binding protein [Prochlorothrix sp.]